MELKRLKRIAICINVGVLIVLYGIETKESIKIFSPKMFVLIVLYGIETC